MAEPTSPTSLKAAQPGRPTSGDLGLVALAAVLTGAAAVTHFTSTPATAAFVVAAIALAALAAVVGRAVGALGDRMGVGATGAIQGALGNLPELLFGIFALRAGLGGVLRAALVGSILANVLLVLGLAFVVGGVRHGVQRFGAERAKLLSLLLLLAVGVLIVPTLASGLDLPAAHHERALSDVAAVILLAVYALSLLADLRIRGAKGSEQAAPVSGRWPLALTLGLLAASAGGAAAASSWFVDSLTPAVHSLGISPTFAGLVIVAIAGNAVENAVGVTLAARNRPDLALSVILQSPLQIALVLIPVLVLVSPLVGGAALTLVFPPLLVASVGVAAVITAFVVADGESTWMEGVALLGLYAAIASAFWWG
ncbi:MAG: sodium:proton exchanger [Acidimicrobiales bacterium]